MKDLVVIIITYKTPSSLREKLERSLHESGIRPEQIFIRDNTKNNVGYAGAINSVILTLLKDFDYFFILNPDVEIKSNALNLLLQTLQTNKKIGIVGPKILDEKENIWWVGGKIDKWRFSGGLIQCSKEGKKQSNQLEHPDFISGTAMLIRKKVFEDIGFFREDYFLYYEDVDFCIRASRAGYKLGINPNAKIIHYASSSTGKDSPLMQYYLARNHLLFVQRFGPIYVKIHEILRIPKTIFEVRGKKYELLGIRDYILRRFGKRDYWS